MSTWFMCPKEEVSSDDCCTGCYSGGGYNHRGDDSRLCLKKEKDIKSCGRYIQILVVKSTYYYILLRYHKYHSFTNFFFVHLLQLQQ